MSWKNTTLYDFLYSMDSIVPMKKDNIPIGWRRFFTRKRTREIISEILPPVSYWIDDYDRDDSGKNVSKEIFLDIFPKLPNVFRAFEKTKLRDIRLIIIGQDPYSNVSKKIGMDLSLDIECAATGLCFDVNDTVINPSLKNIYKKMEMEGFHPTHDGNLEYLADQGMLLLNMSLSVERDKPNSHQHLWRKFRNELIEYIDGYIKRKNKHVIWLLMGANAHMVKDMIKESENHYYICCSHPSPLSCNKPCGKFPCFFEAEIFREINRKLVEWGESEINWEK
jgi:uracil-DNA glycosylase